MCLHHGKHQMDKFQTQRATLDLWLLPRAAVAVPGQVRQGLEHPGAVVGSLPVVVSLRCPQPNHPVVLWLFLSPGCFGSGSQAQGAPLWVAGVEQLG